MNNDTCLIWGCYTLLVLFIIWMLIREWGDNVLVRTNLDIPRKHKGERTWQTLELYVVNNPYQGE